MSELIMEIGSVPPTPPTGSVTIYPKLDKLLYFKDDAGLEQLFSPPTNTDDLPEGVTNLYFTDERAQDSVGLILADTATIDLTYVDGTPAISADLNLLSVTDSHISSSAAIAASKLAAVTASRALVSSGAGFIDVSTVTALELANLTGSTSALQTQIDGKQPLDSDLTALAGVSATGLLARTGAGTAQARTLTATSPIIVADGDGVAGNPTVSLDQSLLSLTKAQVGLGNVDNTSDVNKPVSTAQAVADAAVQAFSIQRANHTGTQLAATISDFSTAADARIALKITDTIADAVTDKAPTQNAVYDALYAAPDKVAANIVAVSGAGPYTVLVTDKTLIVSQVAANSIQLPNPATLRSIIVKDVAGTRSTAAITLVRFASESIDGIAANRLLQSNFGSWNIESNGSNWFITG